MTVDNSWQPTASLDIIRKRAALLWQIRDFMDRHDILEVDTPILSHFAVTDPYIQSLKTNHVFEQDTALYMHTSPEYCMKRLLAADSGSIYQISHVFRDEESGKRHQTEFSMLEWYRVGFDYKQLMDDRMNSYLLVSHRSSTCWFLEELLATDRFFFIMRKASLISVQRPASTNAALI